ncbi:ATP-binding protein [Streptomyces sp. NPDC057280]|uniref:ATP-binding protein n=1 Tax=Streptomyces sp. NPDC057280 TaxID=3346081 RepID=UPI00362B0EAE
MGGSEARRTSGFPTELTSFVGRRDEAAEVRRLLSAGRLLTLTGPGGVGKTRLAGHVARQVARVFPDGVWLVPLAALQDEAFVPHAVIEALGVRNESVRPPLDVLVEYLRERRLLIVLDNCEHVLRSCAVLAATVLAATEGVRVLATSRHRLGLVGERLFEVPPLSAPAPEEVAAGTVAAERFPALRLFADRAAAVVPGFTVGEGNQAAVARLCRRLDGLPLAIELAAVRVRSLGVDRLVERLDDRYRLLTGGSPASAPRHRTLRSAVDWSHELCTAQEQLVWAWLSVFVGSFDLAAAEAVCAGEGIDSADVLDAVAGLVDKSVLVREETGGQVRYRLLVSLRDYGREKLAELGEVTATRRRHRDHFARLAAEYERSWFGPDQAEITDRLQADRHNIGSALDFCLTTPGEAQHGLRFASSLWFHWVADGIWGQGRHWMDRALGAGARPDDALTRAMWAGAIMSLVHTRSAAVLAGTAAPRAAADDELPVPTPPPVPAGLLTPGRSRATLASFVVLTRIELACTLVSRGRPEQAVPLCREAIALCEAYGEQWARGWALRTLALAHWATGEYDSAAEQARACLRLPYTVKQHQSLARTLGLLAAAEESASAGPAERVGVLRGAVDRIWRDIGGNPVEPFPPGRLRCAGRRAREALGDPAYERAHRRGGGLTADEAVAYALGEAAPQVPRQGSEVPPDDVVLTPRETQVAELITQGRTNRQIADALVIAQRTAEGHVERILVKLGFSNRSQVAAWFSAQGEGAAG